MHEGTFGFRAAADRYNKNRTLNGLGAMRVQDTIHFWAGGYNRPCDGALRLRGERAFPFPRLSGLLRTTHPSNREMPEPRSMRRKTWRRLPDEPRRSRDPLEKMNRSVFERNQRFNHAVVYPVAKAYRNNVPEPVRNSVEAFASNLTEPMVFANDVLQLRLGAAATTVGRFAINSTIGVGGLFDVATRQNLPRQSGDLGQTLYVWGMRDSPYLVLPVIGPTNVRDLVGTTAEFVATHPRRRVRGIAVNPARYHGQQPDRRRLGGEPVHQVGPSRPDAGARGELDRLLFHAAQRR